MGINLRSTTGTQLLEMEFKLSSRGTGNITEFGAKNKAASAFSKNEIISVVSLVDSPFCSA